MRRQAPPRYTLITVEGWSREEHYEFRDQADGREPYIEVHVEDPDYVDLKETLRTLVAEL